MNTHARHLRLTPNQNVAFTPITVEQGVLFEDTKIAPPQVEYSILTGHYLEDGSWIDDKKLREIYIKYTDKLIGTIDGTLENERKSDAVIYLDKSARPVAWMVDAFWEMLARQVGTKYTDNIVPKKPDTFFLNIDREQWLPTVDPANKGILNIDAVPEEAIASLRAIYQPIGSTPEAPTILDGKNVLIVDEVNVTGNTLKIAKALLMRALPDTIFTTTHWMVPGTYNGGGASRNNDVPVWYKQHDARGRGVADRDLRRSASSSSYRQQIGKWFLSTAFDAPDKDSLQLRGEIAQLARDVLAGKLQYKPASTRDLTDYDLRFNTLNS